MLEGYKTKDFRIRHTGDFINKLRRPKDQKEMDENEKTIIDSKD